jgi:hypothetical protein
VNQSVNQSFSAYDRIIECVVGQQVDGTFVPPLAEVSESTKPSISESVGESMNQSVSQ